MDVLADGITCALAGDGDFVRLRDVLGGVADQAMGLAAVRVLGADVLAPFVFTGRPITVDDVAVLQAAVDVFPAPSRRDPADAQVWRLKDWALREVVARLGMAELDGPGLAAGDSGGGREQVGELPWPMWAAELVRLSTLALPGLAGPVHDQVRRRREDTLRGVVRALMRTDYLSAARLVRWVALDARRYPEPLLASALEYVELFTAPPPLVRLEIAVARRVLADEPLVGISR